MVQVLRSDGKIEMDSDRLILRDATDVLIVARIEPSDNMEESRVLEMSNALNHMMELMMNCWRYIRKFIKNCLNVFLLIWMHQKRTG